MNYQGRSYSCITNYSQVEFNERQPIPTGSICGLALLHFLRVYFLQKEVIREIANNNLLQKILAIQYICIDNQM